MDEFNEARKYNQRILASIRAKKSAVGQRIRLRAWYNELKSGLKCTDCGMLFTERPECCDFHHRDPNVKDSEVAKMVSLISPREKILVEIEKCDPLCANCHRTRHAKMRAGAYLGVNFC